MSLPIFTALINKLGRPQLERNRNAMSRDEVQCLCGGRSGSAGPFHCNTAGSRSVGCDNGKACWYRAPRGLPHQPLQAPDENGKLPKWQAKQNFLRQADLDGHVTTSAAARVCQLMAGCNPFRHNSRKKAIRIATLPCSQNAGILHFVLPKGRTAKASQLSR